MLESSAIVGRRAPSDKRRRTTLAPRCSAGKRRQKSSVRQASRRETSAAAQPQQGEVRARTLPRATSTSSDLLSLLARSRTIPLASATARQSEPKDCPSVLTHKTVKIFAGREEVQSHAHGKSDTLFPRHGTGSNQDIPNR